MISNYKNNYATCKKSLETEQLAKTRGAIVRARVKWTEEGEKNTKYFPSLEQKRAASNTIKQIQSDQGEIFSDPNDILTETKNTMRNSTLQTTQSQCGGGSETLLKRLNL